MYIKGFDKNLCCRGMQYEIGKEYKKVTDKPLELCTNTVFHFCDSIQKVHQFYSCIENNRFCEIEALGEIVSDDEKCGSNHIKVLREIIGDELKILLGKINGNTGLFNSGDMNSGYMNSGYMNSGDRNSGVFNSCNNSSGIFCSIEPNARIFNIETDMTMREFYNSRYWNALCSAPFNLTEWINYTEAEKTDDAKRATGGYLKIYGYKDACAAWWKKMTVANKKIIMSMPNFNAAVFEEITGIVVTIAGAEK